MDDVKRPIEQIQLDDVSIGQFNADLRRRMADRRRGLDLKGEFAAIRAELDTED